MAGSFQKMPLFLEGVSQGSENFQQGISEWVSLHELIFWSHPRASKQPKGKTTGETEATDSEEAAQTPNVVLVQKMLGETWWECWRIL